MCQARKLTEAYGNSKFRTKIILNLLVVNLLLTVCIASIFLFSYTRVVDQEITKNVRSSLSRLALDLSKLTGQTTDLSNTIVTDPEIRRILLESSEYNDFEKQFADYKQISERFGSFPNDPVISGIRLYLWNSFNSVRRPLSFQNIREASAMNWFHNVYRLNGDYIWTDVTEQKIKGTVREHVISCVRMIKEYSKQEKVLAYLAIDVKERLFYNLIRETERVVNGDIYLVNRAGTVLSSKHAEQLGQTVPGYNDLADAGFAKSSQMLLTIRTVESVVITEPVPGLDWSVVSIISIQALYRTTRQTLFALVTISILVFLLSIALTGLLSKSMTEKIRILIEYVHRLDFERNDFIPMQVRHHDEVSELVQAFNRMALNNQNLVNEVYKKGLESKNAEIKMLQAEINPHFLYNALDAANWMALKYQAKDIMRYLQLLSRFYRLSLSGGRMVVSVGTEIEHVRSYIEIIKAKEDDEIEAFFQVDPEILDYAIPKMVLQPFVENAIIHGIQETKTHIGRVEILGTLAAGTISITIRDNGIGMSAQILDHVRAMLKDGQALSDSYGLKNVSVRLNLFFGSASQIRIDSEPSAGTTVKISFPALRNRQEES